MILLAVIQRAWQLGGLSMFSVLVLGTTLVALLAFTVFQAFLGWRQERRLTAPLLPDERWPSGNG